MYTLDQIEKIRATSKILIKIINTVGKSVTYGDTLEKIDNKIKTLCESEGVTSVLKGYKGFPNYACLSVNNIACHGTVSQSKKGLCPTDCLKIDLAIEKNGWVSDACRTFFIEEVKQFDVLMYSFNKNLVHDTICHLNHILSSKHLTESEMFITPADIANYINKKVKVTRIYSLIEDFGGHGLGKTLHEPPCMVYNPDMLLEKDFKLGNGSVFTIEPILTKKPPNGAMHKGKIRTRILEDGWSVRCRDTVTQFEETVAIINNNIEILTLG